MAPGGHEVGRGSQSGNHEFTCILKRQIRQDSQLQR